VHFAAESEPSIPGLPLAWRSREKERGVEPGAVELQSTENFLALAEGIAEGVALCRGTRVAWANARLATVMGRESPQLLVGLSLDELLQDIGAGLPTARQESRVVCGVRGFAEDERRVEVRRLPGSNLGSNLGSDFADAEQEMWVFADVSHQDMLDREMLAVGRQLHDGNRELARLRQDLSSAATDQEELLSVVSHELRTPLTVMLGYNRLLLSDQVGPLTPEQRRFLLESTKSCQRLDDFVGRLLASSREGVREDALDLRNASIEDTVRGVASFLRPLLEEHELRVELALSSEARTARFDPPRIEQVLTNLLGNAIKYARSGGSVRIETRLLRAGALGFVEVAVMDDGPGVSQADRERIFEPYVRGSSHTEASGLGLGLAISKRIVCAHGGSITVGDCPGGGSRFAFTLPTPPAGVGEE
jgi:signal transduction histidine kinase